MSVDFAEVATAAPCLLDRAVAQAQREHRERRGVTRSAFSYRLRLVADPGEGGEPERSEHYVTSKDLSKFGVGILHDDPLPYRRVTLYAADPRLDALGLGDLRIEVVLRWCRFVGQGEYQSGGRILRTAS